MAGKSKLDSFINKKLIIGGDGGIIGEVDAVKKPKKIVKKVIKNKPKVHDNNNDHLYPPDWKKKVKEVTKPKAKTEVIEPIPFAKSKSTMKLSKDKGKKGGLGGGFVVEEEDESTTEDQVVDHKLKKYRVYEGKLYFSSKCKDCKDAGVGAQTNQAAPAQTDIPVDDILDF